MAGVVRLMFFPFSLAVSSTSRLLAQRAELHMDMKNFTQAIQDADSVCRLLPASPKVRKVTREDFQKLFCRD